MTVFDFRRKEKNMFIIHSMIAVLASLTVTAQQPQPKTIPQQINNQPTEVGGLLNSFTVVEKPWLISLSF